MSLPKSLQARFWGIAPAGGTEFSLSVNGLELVKGRVEGVAIEHAVTLPRLEEAEELLIELVVRAFECQAMLVSLDWQYSPLRCCNSLLKLIGRCSDVNGALGA
jgi:hypothetical protein